MRDALQRSFAGMHALMSALHENLPVDFPGGQFLEDDELSPFQLMARFSRPTEFLQTWLDLVRVIYEPSPPGTFFLNSNLDWVPSEVPARPFRLVYLSAISKPGESVAALDQRVVRPRLAVKGSAANPPSTSFVMVTTAAGNADYSRAIRRQVMACYEAGFHPDEVVGMLKAAIQGEEGITSGGGRVYAGFSQDAALSPDRFRLSLWAFVPVSEPARLM